jgi:tripartite-type tricarboxylate transporter receptor subunit TctC
VLHPLMALACALLGFLSGPAGAAWPEQPITMIVAYAPGGGTDLVARAIAPFIEKYLGDGARIIVLNRTGAGGEIGFAALANAPRDGYTVGFINTPPVLTIPIERKAAYSWLNLELLGNVVDDPGNFSVHADSPFRNLDDLAAYARANPNAVSVGTTGSGSDDHLAMVLFEKIAGVKMNHIPFKGSADVRTALAGKQIVVGAINVGEALQFAKGGAPMRHLGQMSQARSVLAPDLPTFKEQGYDIEMASLRGMAAPRGLPPAVRDRLVKAIEQAAADPGFHLQAAKFFAPLRYLPPAKYETELREGEAQFRQLWNETPWIDK